MSVNLTRRVEGGGGGGVCGPYKNTKVVTVITEVQ